MRHFLVPVAILATASTSLAQPPGLIQSPAYQECVTLANSNPPQALTKAEEWLAIDSGISAQHCKAMALYGLRRYAEAGESLSNLRLAVPEENTALRSFVTRQAVSAWGHAGRNDAALAALDAQINDMDRARGNNAANAKLTSELLTERARLLLGYGKSVQASKDLDRAVSLTPANPDLLAERGENFLHIGDINLARADAEAALSMRPEHAKARALLMKLDTKPAATDAPVTATTSATR